MRKTKRRKRNEITKMVLKGMLIGGGVLIASSNPYFATKILPKLWRYASWKIRKNAKEKKKIYNSFYVLKKRGLIKVENRAGQIYISLTKEGRKEAGKFQVDDMKIKTPKKWDGRWRIIIFDIKNEHRIKREALRGKIKQLGLYQLQKSVWVYPFDFKKEINLLRSFFELNHSELKIITAFEIEEDKELKVFFHLG